ncbi:hypothetical protein, partial [Streptobacillus moniliformis]|uniref:hypothetical protein n=1 Tax=Streptobacillus moniliformis TaxID=34105 RepID=UPI001E4316D9
MTYDERVIIRYRGKEKIDISRGLLNNNGAPHVIDIKIEDMNLKDILSIDVSTNTFNEKRLENIEK